MDDQDRKAVLKSMYIDLHKKEFSIGQLLILSWDVFSKNFYILVLTGLIMYLPVFIASEVIIVSELGLTQLSILGIIAFISLAVSIIVTLSYYRIIESHLNNSIITIGDALSFSMNRLGKAAWTSIIAGVIVLLLSLLLIIPGIIWGIYYGFILFVVAQKNIGGWNALAVSKSLVVGRWWKVFWYGLVISMVVAMGAILLEAPISMFTEGVTSRMFADVFSIILSAYATTAYILFYINLQHNSLPVKPPPIA